MVVYYRLLGSATTDDNGVASYTYTGHGSGEMDFIASTSNPIDDSSLVSEIYEVIDALFYDDNSNTNWYTQNWTVNRQTDGVLLSSSNSGWNFHSAKATATSDNPFTAPFKVEFDIINASGTVSFQIRNDSASTNYVQYTLPTNVSNYHVEVICNDGSQSLKIDGSQVYSNNKAMTSAKVQFISNTASSSVKYKNFVVYTI